MRLTFEIVNVTYYIKHDIFPPPRHRDCPQEFSMKEILIDYGDGKMAIELPGSAVVVRYGETYKDPAPCDPHEATRHALKTPPRIQTAVRTGQRAIEKSSSPSRTG